MTDEIGSVERYVYEPGAVWRDDVDVGDGEAPWCPRVEPGPDTPMVHDRIDKSRVSIDDLSIVTVVAVDSSFCFPDRTGNEILRDGGSIVDFHAKRCTIPTPGVAAVHEGRRRRARKRAAET